MLHPLSGVQEKLKRANENILNLEREISLFLQQGPNPVIPNDDLEAFQEALKLHAETQIPERFSILAGEIVHHLRSCLNNIAWELSSPKKRLDDPRGIEFPIYIGKPANKSELRRYERKIEGIPARGRKIIEGLQPYHRAPAMLTGPRSHPLWIIHDMDTVDKHRELILATAAFDIADVGGIGGIWLTLYRQGDFPEGDIAGLARAFNANCKITTQVAFREFDGRKVQPVIPSLQKLTRAVQEVVLMFMDECF